jgi:hypothetical protein
VISALRSRLAAHARAFGGYLAVVLCFNWPLPAQLGTALPGPISGDTGVYVWNLWVFRHEVLRHGRFPLFTGEILSLTPTPVDLSLHNYTLFPDLLAFPLIAPLGVVTTFNVIYLSLAAFTAWTMFVLARAIVKRDGEAWLAGLLFGLSPVLVARSMEHFSLTVAAPLPLFVLALMHADRRNDLRYAAAAGATAAWASMCDPYYGIFCVMIAACYLAGCHILVRRSAPGLTAAGYMRAVDMTLAGIATLIVAIVVFGGTEFRSRYVRVQIRSLYTPILLLTTGLILRAWLVYRPQWRLRMPPPGVVLRLVTAAGLACVLPLTPVLYALAYRLSEGGQIHQPLLWRSSPSGVDALALFLPNPNHGLFGAPWRAWLTSQPNGYVENVASITFVAVAIIALAAWRYRFRPPAGWVALTAFFGLLSLGPFIHVGGINTFIPGPWALLRYVPIVTAVRMPQRFVVVLLIGWALLFALALAHVCDRHPRRRLLLLTAVGLALGFELAPLPRTVYSAHLPAIYSVIREDSRDVRVLELPFGMRDGERSVGNFNAASQFYQTFHRKRLIGGYLSRISNRRIERTRSVPMIKHLLLYSAGGLPEPLPPPELMRRARTFLQVSRLGYVVIDMARTSPALRLFAIETFRLEKIGESDGRELYKVPAWDTF